MQTVTLVGVDSCNPASLLLAIHGRVLAFGATCNVKRLDGGKMEVTVQAGPDFAAALCDYLVVWYARWRRSPQAF